MYILFVDAKRLSIASVSEIHPIIARFACLSNSRVFGADLSTLSTPLEEPKLAYVLISIKDSLV